MVDLFSGQLLIAALVLAAMYGLVALGLNLIYGTMRLLNVAHGEILMLGGYLAYWTFTLTGVGPVWSMFLRAWSSPARSAPPSTARFAAGCSGLRA